RSTSSASATTASRTSTGASSTRAGDDAAAGRGARGRARVESAWYAVSPHRACADGGGSCFAATPGRAIRAGPSFALLRNEPVPAPRRSARPQPSARRVTHVTTGASTTRPQLSFVVHKNLQLSTAPGDRTPVPAAHGRSCAYRRRDDGRCGLPVRAPERRRGRRDRAPLHRGAAARGGRGGDRRPTRDRPRGRAPARRARAAPRRPAPAAGLRGEALRGGRGPRLFVRRTNGRKDLPGRGLPPHRSSLACLTIGALSLVHHLLVRGFSSLLHPAVRKRAPTA